MSGHATKLSDGDITVVLPHGRRKLKVNGDVICCGHSLGAGTIVKVYGNPYIKTIPVTPVNINHKYFGMIFHASINRLRS